MFTGKTDVIFSGPKFSCALRNIRKSFRELYGTVFGPETFSGLLRNARQNTNLHATYVTYLMLQLASLTPKHEMMVFACHQ